jgi:hypothetical protein
MVLVTTEIMIFHGSSNYEESRRELTKQEPK